MPKNKGKGGKNRRRGKNENDIMKRELIEKDSDNQAYAQVMKMLGNGRLTAFCFDGKTRLCHIRGKLRKKVWINTGDIILVGLRDYQDDKADVILKYTPDEARILKNTGQLPESAKLNEIGEDENAGDVEFVDSGEHDLADEVSAQGRDYIITSSESESETDSDDESSDGDAAGKQQGRVAPPSTTKNANKGPSKSVGFKQSAKADSASSEEEEDSSSEDESEEDPEMAAQRAAAAAESGYRKPGARDRHTAGGHARGKGKRGK